jgi:hypothetical protein
LPLRLLQQLLLIKPRLLLCLRLLLWLMAVLQTAQSCCRPVQQQQGTTAALMSHHWHVQVQGGSGTAATAAAWAQARMPLRKTHLILTMLATPAPQQTWTLQCTQHSALLPPACQVLLLSPHLATVRLRAKQQPQVAQHKQLGMQAMGHQAVLIRRMSHQSRPPSAVPPA